jgi:hypothetical protein
MTADDEEDEFSELDLSEADKRVTNQGLTNADIEAMIKNYREINLVFDEPCACAHTVNSEGHCELPTVARVRGRIGVSRFNPILASIAKVPGHEAVLGVFLRYSGSTTHGHHCGP